MNLKMGDEEVTEVLVEFLHDGEVIFSRKHSSTEGTPDLESEKKALRNCCLAAVTGPPPVVPVRVSRPTGPVGVQSGGWGGTATVVNDSEDAAVRAKLFQSLTGGGW